MSGVCSVRASASVRRAYLFLEKRSIFATSLESSASEAFEIGPAIGVMTDRHLRCDPCKRNVRLGAAQLDQRRLCRFRVAGTSGSRDKDAVGADKIGALAQGLARQAHGFIVMAAEELGVSIDPHVNRGVGIA